MKIITTFSVIIMSFSLTSCGGAKKQTLETKQDETVVIARDLNQQSTIVYNAAKLTGVSLTPPNNVGGKGSKALNSTEMPVKLNLANDNLSAIDYDLAQDYSKVSYVKLKHPLGDKGGFLNTIELEVNYERGAMFVRGFSSIGFVTDSKIIAGDNYFGYHVYDRSGEFMYTIALAPKLPHYTSNSKKISLEKKRDDDAINSFSVFGNHARILITENKKPVLHYYNIDTQKGEYSLTTGAALMPINATNLLFMNSNPFKKQGDWLMATYNASGEGICAFPNSQPEVENRKVNFQRPESDILYYYKDNLTIRQAYSDTVFRVKTTSKIDPVFILEKGARSCDAETGMYGDKRGKILISNLIETDDKLFIACTDNVNSPINQKSGEVSYMYYIYDKKSGEMQIEKANIDTDDYTLKNTIEGGIPVFLTSIGHSDDLIYASYGKNSLAKMIADASFHKLPQGQQDQLKELDADLKDGEMLVMIIEK